MATSSDSTSPAAVVDPFSSAKENMKPMNARFKELQDSRTELMNRLQSLKQDLHNWRSKLDTQAKIYNDELTEVKKSLNDEVEQLRTEFQGLRATLQQQQEDLTTSLTSFELQDALRNKKWVVEHKVNGEVAQSDDVGSQPAEDSKTEGHNAEAEASRESNIGDIEI